MSRHRTIVILSCSILAHPQDGSSSSSSGANDLLTSVKKGLPELRKSLSDFAPSVGDHLGDINLPDLPFAVNTSALPSIEEGDKLIEEKCLKNGGNGSYAEAMEKCLKNGGNGSYAEAMVSRV
ncbi:hypothetical protein LSTR_LSTR012663 [Laodelphax striatellus]|uniref:Uncharacterized protein n=1 Tax=Laodelphax striatellus TaxID=195883 RepID=A0A482WYS7_LAOST|nr:hypothetical protein LSTR_LSTR012663 [Laodelphax striatellus]